MMVTFSTIAWSSKGDTVQTMTRTPGEPLPDRPDDAVVIDGLVKYYPDPEGGTFAAVDGIDLRVRRGEIFGILGPNGAGKTTTLEIVEGLTRADAGSVSVLGLDPARETLEVQQRIGVQLQSSAYFEFLRLGELLDLFGGFYPKRLPTEDLLARVGLTEKRNALVGELSGGQAQRFSIVAALVNDPEVVFLDEPTTGLDPQARRSVWEVIRTLADEGRTVILTTHYMEEAAALADRIAVIDHGRIAAIDTPAALVERQGSGTTVTFTTPSEVAPGSLEGLEAVRSVRARRNGIGTYELAVDAADIAVPALYDWAGESGIELRDMSIRRSTLEDVFLNLTGSRLRD
jgi:ABC-2 type transport system ATP-binding protein